MMKKPTIICIIPARLNSSRFPEKILAHLQGRPLIEHVWNAAVKTNLFSEIVIAIDSPKTEKIIQTFNGNYVMTSLHHTSGTSRLIEVMQHKRIHGDIWVNWQGDEPFIHSSMINDLLQTCSDTAQDIWTLKKRITKNEDLANPNIVKVVTDANDNALYFSRSPIPFYRTQDPSSIYYQHIGLYAYTTEALKKIAHLPPAQLEEAEMLEQLRFLYHTMKIQVHETQHEAHGINTYEDLVIAQKYLSSSAQLPY